MDYQTLHGT